MDPITVVLGAGYLISCFVAGGATGLAIGWLVDFLARLWEHYPKIKEKINEFLVWAKTEVRVVIDKVLNPVYRTVEYVLKCFGIEKERKMPIINDRIISLEEMKEMGYQGGDHYEYTLTMAQ